MCSVVVLWWLLILLLVLRATVATCFWIVALFTLFIFILNFVLTREFGSAEGAQGYDSLLQCRQK